MSTTKLLLVDDDEFVRGALTRALNRTGAFSVVPAEHGRHALELLASERIDAMLTDLQMPVMDGLTLLGHLFERGIRVPVAVMTGQAIAPELKQRLQGYGIAATFTKPVDLSSLTDELQRSLDPDTVGRIKGITLFGLLQLLEVERKTALVVVHATGREGRLYFDDGRLVHSHTRQLGGLEAAYEILAWSDPTVEIFYKRRSRERTVKEPLQQVLMEAARLLDERRRTLGSAGADATSAEPESPDTEPGPDRPLVQTVLEEALEIDGAMGIAVVDVPSGMTLGEACGSPSFNMELAAAMAADLVRAQLKGMGTMKLDDKLQDIMVTLGKQYHVIRFLGAPQDSFLYLVLARERANLGMARHQLAKIALRITL
ncbi:MAG TPA: response regulator [Gemmatimonadales bacterium]|nr:response regulator [Gemmatimonadales bacterium]